MSHNPVEPPSSDHDDVQTYKRTIQRVNRSAKKKAEELEDEQLVPRIEKVVRRIKRRRSGFPRSGTDG